MAKFQKKTLQLFYRNYLFLLGFLFLFISGCRSRSVEHSVTGTDSLKNDGHLLIVPEYGVQPAQWEEMPFEEAIPDKKNLDIGKYTEQADSNKTKTLPSVFQPSPDPMNPATAYGTNMHDYKPTITITPKEE
jgi:hypothetical protein